MNRFKHLNLAKKNRESNPESFARLYDSLVESKIRKRYTVSQELSILRQKSRKPEEFAEYDAFAEQCKSEAKHELDMG